MGTWLGGIIEKNFDKLMMFVSMLIWLLSVLILWFKGADDKVLFFAFGAVNNFIGALMILCNVKRSEGGSATPVTSGTTTETTITTKAVDAPPIPLTAEPKGDK